MNILICTDGSKEAEQAAKFISLMNFEKSTNITILSVLETDGNQTQLQESIDRIVNALDRERYLITTKIRRGESVEQILLETKENSYDLVAIGASGHHRGFLLINIGSTSQKLARKLETSFLVVRKVPEKINKVLICTAAEEPSLETLNTAAQMLKRLDAELAVLHVMSQVALKPDSPIQDLLDTAETAISRGTREGKHLQTAMQILKEYGITSKINPILRHGLVVDEVLEEIKEGNYDLLVVGAHHQPGRSKWLEMLLDDVTDQLLRDATCSVMVI